MSEKEIKQLRVWALYSSGSLFDEREKKKQCIQKKKGWQVKALLWTNCIRGIDNQSLSL